MEEIRIQAHFWVEILVPFRLTPRWTRLALALDVLAHYIQALRCIPAVRLVGQFRDFQTLLDLLPFALIHNGLLQRRGQACADDVADLLGLEQTHYGFVVEAAVSAKQSHLGIP